MYLKKRDRKHSKLNIVTDFEQSRQKLDIIKSGFDQIIPTNKYIGQMPIS